MGLFGGDSSSSQQTNIRTENVGADQGSISASYSTVNVLDAGAVSDAFDFSNAALNETLDAAFGFARESLGLVQTSTERTIQSADKALEATLASRDEAQSGGAERLLILGGLAVAALVAVAYFR